MRVTLIDSCAIILSRLGIITTTLEPYIDADIIKNSFISTYGADFTVNDVSNSVFVTKANDRTYLGMDFYFSGNVINNAFVSLQQDVTAGIFCN